MSMKLSPGKRAGIEAVSDKRGVIAAVALDQRGLLKNMLAREMGKEPSDAAVMEFKQLTASILTREVSSILLDVQYGLPASKHINGKGLLLAYEKSGYSPEFPEKLPTLTEGWSALRLKAAGANAVKVLLFYSPFEDKWVNEQKKAWVERIGAECCGLDICMFLELLSYEVGGGDESNLAYARRKPEIVRAAMEEFSKERYRADVLKVEFPVQMAFTEGTSVFNGERAYGNQEAMDLIHGIASLTDKPIVYLSAGVSNAAFVESLGMAAASGAKFHGVLCGRATWQDGVSIYVRKGAKALKDWLSTVGLENVRNVNEALSAALPWHAAGSMQG